MSRLGRRALLANGALVVAFAMSRTAVAQDADKPPLPGNLAKFPLLDSWISVDGDGQITVFTGKAELGQGLKTALIQIVAEELAIAPSAVEIVTADTARTPDEGVTAGSHSMQDSGTAILNAADNRIGRDSAIFIHSRAQLSGEHVFGRAPILGKRSDIAPIGAPHQQAVERVVRFL